MARVKRKIGKRPTSSKTICGYKSGIICELNNFIYIYIYIFFFFFFKKRVDSLMLQDRREQKSATQVFAFG